MLNPFCCRGPTSTLVATAWIVKKAFRYLFLFFFAQVFSKAKPARVKAAHQGKNYSFIVVRWATLSSGGVDRVALFCLKLIYFLFSGC